MFLAVADRAEEAIAQVKLGRPLNSLSVLSHGFASVSFAVLDRLEAAESAASQAFELQPDSRFEDVERRLSSGRSVSSGSTPRRTVVNVSFGVKWWLARHVGGAQRTHRRGRTR